ncbi:hypothetical protein A4W93_19050 [Piscinibacter gummiphilus]|uniref:Uncharacterized protein n=2 Tax=Piscinibacter gummiphilus TaxID=946333 RepID=A0A1W6LC41_9BURK|nr:hypothetical protein A4W93_19050 [Piscinibacter gummiphilus]ATU66510.1 SMI1/KNR4 family protein [Piscinibacter gummiphilus]GLS95306.1 hypothetical protein GCM10007918_25980 [Piscinibacter gummiphilus]
MERQAPPMQDLADRYLLARRKRWFRTRPVVAQRGLPSERELLSLEQRIGCALPSDLRAWLSTVGFCDIDDELSFRAEWFNALDPGQLAGAVLFAQDILGRFYGFMPTDGRIVFFARSEPGLAVLATNFREFLQQLADRDFNVVDWADSVELTPYQWNVDAVYDGSIGSGAR